MDEGGLASCIRSITFLGQAKSINKWSSKQATRHCSLTLDRHRTHRTTVASTTASRRATGNIAGQRIVDDALEPLGGRGDHALDLLLANSANSRAWGISARVRAAADALHPAGGVRVGAGGRRARRAHGRCPTARGAVPSSSAGDGLAVRAADAAAAADALHAPPATAHHAASAGGAARRVAVHRIQTLLGRRPDLLVGLISAGRVGRAPKVETRLDRRDGLVILHDRALEHAPVHRALGHLGDDAQALVLDVGVGLGGEPAGEVAADFHRGLGGGGGVLGNVRVQVSGRGGRGGLGRAGQGVAVHDALFGGYTRGWRAASFTSVQLYTGGVWELKATDWSSG